MVFSFLICFKNHPFSLLSNLGNFELRLLDFRTGSGKFLAASSYGARILPESLLVSTDAKEGHCMCRPETQAVHLAQPVALAITSETGCWGRQRENGSRWGSSRMAAMAHPRQVADIQAYISIIAFKPRKQMPFRSCNHKALNIAKDSWARRACVSSER